MDDYFRRWVKNPTPEIEEFWEQWMKLHPNQKETVREARRLLRTIDFEKTPPDKIPAAAILERIQTTIRQSAEQEEIERAYRPHRRILWHKVAAVLVALMIIGGGIYYGALTGLHQITWQTKFDEQREIVLPDQSVVTLYANSTLRYPDTWDDANLREVWLSGDAFFEVKKYPHQGNARFVVHTNNLHIAVLGTAFNVNNRRGQTRVLLKEGSVQLTDAATQQQQVTMKPGELAALAPGQEKITKTTVTPEAYAAWHGDALLFEKTALREILLFIEDNYGLTVQAHLPALEAVTFTGTIPDRDLETLLNVIAETYQVDITRDDETLVMTSRAVPSTPQKK